MIIERLFNRATTPEPRGRQGWSRSVKHAGIRVTEDAALTYSAVWACVNYIAGSIAALPWHLFEMIDEKNKKRVVNPVDWLLSTQTNPEMSSFSFRETILQWALLWGNGVGEIEADMAGRPHAIWPIEPYRVNIVRDKANNLLYEIANERQANTLLEPHKVFHLHGMGFDGLQGYSVVSYAARSVGVGIAADEFGASFYGNGTQLGLTLEHPNKMSQAAKDDLIKAVKEKMQGPKNAFNLMIFEEGMKVADTGMPLTDAQFIESKAWNVTDVARWFRVPPHKIGDLSKATFSNIEHQGIEAVIDCLLPWIVRIETEAKLKLCGRFKGKRFTKMNLNSLMRGDSKSRGEFYKTMHSIGAFSTNDILELEDRNTIGPEGDKRLVQLNQTTLEKIGEEPPKPPTAPEPTEPPEPDATKDAMRSLLSVHVTAATKRAAFRCSEKKDKSTDEFYQWLNKFIGTEKLYLKERLSEAITTIAKTRKLDEQVGLAAYAAFEKQHFINIENMALGIKNGETEPEIISIANALTDSIIESIFATEVTA